MKKDKDIINIIADEAYDVSQDVFSDIGIDNESEQISGGENVIKELSPQKYIGNTKNKILNYMETLPKNLSKKYICISASVCVIILAAAAAMGFLLPKSENTISNRLASLHESDSDYLSAKEANDAENLDKKNLNTRLENKQQELEEFRQSQDNLEKITENIGLLENERDSLKNDIKTKQNTLAGIEADINSFTKKIMTWTSGDYTVGENIAAGSYTITGTGSIAIANSGKSLANKILSSAGESFTLNNGDIIHIDGNAKIVPE